jgi:hypothetical protein
MSRVFVLALLIVIAAPVSDGLAQPKQKAQGQDAKTRACIQAARRNFGR